ncbi:hypothetical protein [Clostridium sp.]|uniref:hypothetical protein n=1 Tax=Clostridium sp. TaxID=1506 RepID=UPI002914F306|nr:hypothetical protein [Clostridium sp.]MDU4726364.1 hypothetical protein [Clostridium sp.]
MKAIDVLIATINAQLTVLNRAGYNIFDSNDQDFYLIEVRYDENEDRLYFDCQEVR